MPWLRQLVLATQLATFEALQESQVEAADWREKAAGKLRIEMMSR